MRAGTLLRSTWENEEQQTKNKTFHSTLCRRIPVNYWTNLYFCCSLNIFASTSKTRACTHWFLHFRPSRQFGLKKHWKIKLDVVRCCDFNDSNFPVVAGSIRIRLFLGSGYLSAKNHQFLQMIGFQQNPSFLDTTVCPWQKSTFNLTN